MPNPPRRNIFAAIRKALLSGSGPKSGMLGRSYHTVAADLERAGYPEAANNLRRYMEGAEFTQPVVHGTSAPNIERFNPGSDGMIHAGNADQANSRLAQMHAGEFKASMTPAEVAAAYPNGAPLPPVNLMPLWARGKYAEFNDLGGWDVREMVDEGLRRGYFTMDEAKAILTGQQSLGAVLTGKGYSGIKYKNMAEGGAARTARGEATPVPNGGDEQFSLAVFPETRGHLKSATGNRGTFNPADPNILRAVGPMAVAREVFSDPTAQRVTGLPWRGAGAGGDILDNAQVAQQQTAGWEHGAGEFFDIRPSLNAIREGLGSVNWRQPMSRENAAGYGQAALGALDFVF